MSRILIVDDDTASCRTLELHFRSQGHEARSAHSVDDGLAVANDFNPEMIVLDIRMPGRSGLEGLPDFKERFPQAAVIIITAYHDMESTIQAMQRGADDYIHKPIDIDEIDTTIFRLLASASATKDRFETDKNGDADVGVYATMVGRSRAMKEVFKTIGLVATSPATVLITGESGTGKELVAQAIHAASRTPDGPFVAVNCAALVETLLESDMFGHERGAFTGAATRQPGKFALACGGTIFLDEVSEMSPAMQAKLLRVLQEREFTPIGAKQSQHTDARVIAATNVDLVEKVSEGTFREDLFYRLQVVSIHLPPLRDRREDILDLVQVLLSRINRDLNSGVTSVAMEVIQCFQEYDWPGNVRELENSLMKSAALCTGHTITMDLLSDNIRCAHGQLLPEFEIVGGRPLTELSLDEIQMHHVKRVLDAHDWHKGAACEVLGVSRPRLRRMIQQFSLEPPVGVAGNGEDNSS